MGLHRVGHDWRDLAAAAAAAAAAEDFKLSAQKTASLPAVNEQCIRIIFHDHLPCGNIFWINLLPMIPDPVV